MSQLSRRCEVVADVRERAAVAGLEAFEVPVITARLSIDYPQLRPLLLLPQSPLHLTGQLLDMPLQQLAGN